MTSPDIPPVPQTCKYCLNEHVKECLMCKSRYCVLHAAKFSPNFCKDCLTNLSVIMDAIVNTSAEYDMLDDKVILRHVGATTLKLDGPDWIFYSQWISALPEEQWLEIYQFHYYVLKHMEYENEVRKVKRAKRIANAPLSVKISKEVKTKKEAKPVDMQTNFERLGIPEATIRVMLAAVGIQYREKSNGNNGAARPA